MENTEEELDPLSPNTAALMAAGKRCVSTQAQWPLSAESATCTKCYSEIAGEHAAVAAAASRSVPRQQQQRQQQQQQQPQHTAAGDASDSTSETSETSETSSRVTSLLDGDVRCYGDFLNEEAWLDRMLEQLGLPRPYYNEGPVSANAATAAAAATTTAAMAGPVAAVAAGGGMATRSEHGAIGEPEKELAELSAEEYYHKELRDVLWTIVSLKLDDMRVATSQMRAAWKSYVRNSKIVDEMLQNKDRAVRALKEQLVQLKLENKSLRERICEGPSS